MSACKLLHQFFDAMPRLSPDLCSANIPANGIYAVFEVDEEAHGGNRIVRIGTHTGQGNLRGRLIEHLLKPNKDRSIFRKHVGRAILAERNDPALDQWNLKLTRRKARAEHGHRVDPLKMTAVETEVSQKLRARMSFAVLPLSGGKEDRLAWEKRMLSTIAACPDCRPSPIWLGLWHPDPRIGRNGLWNIQGFRGEVLSEDDVRSFTRLRT
ncbi:hypothetical protein FDP22_05955 [Paroceanicella profunda]|uniref:GIY-YIG domain-containing protein n=1 Tax=Paroceanicella profunda TaxID=2579971 RepID=A0A5B8FXY0_9RHOB|nr:hypothetical protein [Paroceanicella profunda]QDL91372.1 hypothetical protein FDP22_05955 [Paroceanicella profunda]